MSTNYDFDTSPMPPLEYDKTKVPELSRQHADYVRTKTYGHDVRESLARGVEYAGLVANTATKTASEIKIRQDQLEKYNDDVLAEITGKDVLSAPEIVAARDGMPSLKARLDRDRAEVPEMPEVTQSANGFFVNILDFGAKYNDPTFDNMPILSKAQDFVVANGGGRIFIPDKGVLYVKPFLKLKSGVHIEGATSRPIVRICPDVTNFYMLFGIEYVNNTSIINLEIDSNFPNRKNYDITVAPQILIQLSEANYCDVSNNTLRGNGVWIFACFTGGQADYSRFVKFNDNHIIWTAGLATDKIGATHDIDVDNTIVYWDAIDYEMRNNYLETANSKKNMTCIEIHGAHAVMDNNTIRGFRTGVIVWSLIGNMTASSTVVENNIYITNNNFVNVEAGITNGSSASPEAYHDLDNVYIENNNILMAPSNFDRSSGRGIEINLATGSKNMRIRNNIIESLPNTRALSDPDTIYNYTGLTVNGGDISGLMVTGNTFKNINGVGLFISAAYGRTVLLEDSVIEGNLFIDCGRGGNITPAAYSPKTAMTINRNTNTVIKRTKIGVNHIRDTKATGTYFDRPVFGLLASDEDQDVQTVSRESWVGKVQATVKIQIDGGENEYVRPTTENSRNVKYVKDEVSISHTVWIDKDYTGGNLYMHLPLTANVDTWNYYPGAWSHYKSDTDEVVTGRFIIKPDNPRIAWFVLPDLKGIQLKRNDYLWFDLTYPVDQMSKYRVE